MNAWIAVAIGGAIGSVARYGLTIVVSAIAGADFPWATLLINILGSAVIGLFAALGAPDSRFVMAPEWLVFVTAGLCGGFTTFSAFSLQTLMLLREGQAAWALAYVALSVGLCLAGVWLGYVAGAALAR
ncbi:MAG: fluoride efflux transporter CrcB [Geminicoccaceae bacterium]